MDNDTLSTMDDTYLDYGEYESEICIKNAVRQFGAIYIPVLCLMVAVLSLFGNVLVLVILGKYENLKSLANMSILNLALSDLFFTMGLPFWAYNHMYGWTLGERACNIVSFIFYLGFYSSGILLILMTAHRYIAVMRPMSDVVSTTGLYSVIASVMVWAVSVLMAGPAFLFTTVHESDICGFATSYWTVWGIYQQNALFLLTSAVFIFCYSQIVCRLLRPSAQRRRNKTLKLIFILMVVFFVGWGPYNIIIFLQSSKYTPQPPADSQTLAAGCEQDIGLDYALYVGRLFAFSHCCLNPVLYVFAGVKFRSHLKKLLQSLGSSGNNSLHRRQSRLTVTSLTSGEEFSL